MNKIHFLGVCGTFMASLAILAQELGFIVSGQDEVFYPPMSNMLVDNNITIIKGYLPDDIPSDVDTVIIGNALSRENPAVEFVLNQSIDYLSGPQFLESVLLCQRHVLVVAGTHGKTTTASMLAWMLECGQLNPGFLIGGQCHNFPVSARVGNSPYFVIEGDEYDTAFFDKQSKFLHYRPRTLIINNIEFDHADIFSDLAAIKRSFELLLRCLPEKGLLIYPHNDPVLKDVIRAGFWSQQQTIGIDKGQWHARSVAADGSSFELWCDDQLCGVVAWKLLGEHNILNALAAAAAASHVGVDNKYIIQALNSFKGVKRRMDVIAHINNITLYDDFAHHPTAIKTTLAGLKNHVTSTERIIVLLHCASNTMQGEVNQAALADSLLDADHIVMWQDPNIKWDLDNFCKVYNVGAEIINDIDEIVARWATQFQSGDHVVLMSNKSFGGLSQKLCDKLSLID